MNRQLVYAVSKTIMFFFKYENSFELYSHIIA